MSHVALGSEIIFTTFELDVWLLDLKSLVVDSFLCHVIKFKRSWTISGWVIDDFDNFCVVVSRCHFDLWLRYFEHWRRSGVMCSNYVTILNLSEIDQSAAESLMICYGFSLVFPRCPNTDIGGPIGTKFLRIFSDHWSLIRLRPPVELHVLHRMGYRS